MTIKEKVAYLKGLVEGKELDPESGEGKLWRVVVELMSDVATELSILKADQGDLSDTMEQLSDELDFLEDILGADDFDDDDDDDDADDLMGRVYPFSSFGSTGDYEDEEDEEDMITTYEIVCPDCGALFEFGEEEMEDGFLICPDCGEKIELQDLDDQP